MNKIKYIDILLPFKETFEKNNASAVSLTILNSYKFSKYKKKIRIFGKKIQNPLLKNYYSLNTNRFFDLGNNRSIAKSYYRINKNSNSLIEIHNRPKIFRYLINKTKNPLSLHFHNDPTKMVGSKTVYERRYLADNAAAIYFVSDFIKKKFCLNLKKKYNNLHILFNGIERKINKKPKKEKIILFVGRLVKAKGIIIFLNSIKKILNENINWSAYVIGTVKPGYDLFSNTLYLKSKTDKEGIEIIKAIKKISKKNKNFKYLSFISNNKVQELMKKSSILIVPSIWDDPCPLTPIEGLSNGCAVVTTNRGGIPEIIKNNGVLINKINSQKLYEEVKNLILSKRKMNKYLNLAWFNYDLNLKKFVAIQDKLREEILNK